MEVRSRCRDLGKRVVELEIIPEDSSGLQVSVATRRRGCRHTPPVQSGRGERCGGVVGVVGEYVANACETRYVAGVRRQQTLLDGHRRCGVGAVEPRQRPLQVRGGLADCHVRRVGR